ncbi:hypothetical protein, partial [Escherichia coli]|uniref:hypothetical protein n=1 Tax=Escherichia coli TaxID=562 RepID=UPI002280A761
MDAAAEPPRMGSRRVLHRPAPAAPPDARQAQRFPHYTPPIQQKPLIGMKLVVSYLSLMDRPLDERTVLQMQLSSGLLY